MTRAAKPRAARTTKAREASEKVRTARSDARAAALGPIITKIQARGVTTLDGIALVLNAHGEAGDVVINDQVVGCWPTRADMHHGAKKSGCKNTPPVNCAPQDVG